MSLTKIEYQDKDGTKYWYYWEEFELQEEYMKKLKGEENNYEEIFEKWKQAQNSK